MSFLDAFQGYHQIPLALNDQEKTAFVTPTRNYHYIVMVKKKKGKWQVFVDFTNLNKTCPKDPFTIPRIGQLVDATIGHPRMSFLDAFQGFHQIPLALDD